MKIYTKAGDDGSTGLYGGSRLAKSDARVCAYGEVDELNSTLGLARALGQDAAIDACLQRVQHALFNVGAELACLPGSSAMQRIVKVEAEHVAQLEASIDAFETELAPLRQFILPGGHVNAAALHLARTVCRRAERQLVQLQQTSEVREVLVQYLNRLSDLLFVVARLANHKAGHADVAWQPQEPA